MIEPPAPRIAGPYIFANIVDWVHESFSSLCHRPKFHALSESLSSQEIKDSLLFAIVRSPDTDDVELILYDEADGVAANRTLSPELAKDLADLLTRQAGQIDCPHITIRGKDL